MNKKLSMSLLVISGLIFVPVEPMFLRSPSEKDRHPQRRNEFRGPDFLNDPAAQERALKSYFGTLETANQLFTEDCKRQQRINNTLQRCEDKLDQASYSLRTGANEPFSGAHRDDEYSKCNLEESLNRWSRASEARHQTSTQAFPSSIFRGRN